VPRLFVHQPAVHLVLDQRHQHGEHQKPAGNLKKQRHRPTSQAWYRGWFAPIADCKRFAKTVVLGSKAMKSLGPAAISMLAVPTMLGSP
jgi:hypothetical protein